MLALTVSGKHGPYVMKRLVQSKMLSKLSKQYGT